jgi:hypothetical protein
MFRRTIHRGIAVLSLVTFLAVAGAQPAAAAPNAGFLDRLAGLWSAVAGGEPDTLWNRLAGWLEGQPAAKSSSTTTTPVDTTQQRGGGIDPNGTRVVVEMAPPPDGGN